jgi:hypothetical protein
MTMALTTVPPSFADLVHEGELRAIPRREWHLYREILTAGLDRIRFASYGVQNCIPPDSGSSANMVAGIRFADTDSLWVGRGRGKLADMSGDQKAEAFAEIARSIVELDGFVGRECCIGDRFVEDVADRRVFSRRHEEWRKAGTVHDFVLTTQALAAVGPRRSLERRSARRPDAGLRSAAP